MEATIHKLETNIFTKIEYILEWGGIKKDILFLIWGSMSVFASLFDIQPFTFDVAWLAIILCGLPIVLGAIIGLVRSLDIKADVLVSLALIATIITGEIFAAAEIAFIMQIGALLEKSMVAKARTGIEKLMVLMPSKARLLTSSGEEAVPVEKIMLGDIIRVLPGETVPVDGEIISGETSINQSVLTGESLPVDKSVGDLVSSGTVNQFGTFDMRVTKVGADSSIQRMIRLVQAVDVGKAKIVSVADYWATRVVVIALLAAIVTWAVTGEVLRAVTVLVVFCPCALVLATPTAIMAAISNATKHGFLIREGDALERLASVTKVILDKTGTLTYGKPQVVAVELVKNKDMSATDLFTKTMNPIQAMFKLVASLEALSEHPLGKAVVTSYKEMFLNQEQDMKHYTDSTTDSLFPCRDFKMLVGRGVSGIVEEQQILAGNGRLLAENNIAFDDAIKKNVQYYLDRGSTIIYVAIAGTLVGFIALADAARPESAFMINSLQQKGIQTALLTGDNESSAYHIGSQLGIREVTSNCMPEDKLHYIVKHQEAGQILAMIGDGINDAPALKKSYVGIAMGHVGSDIAIDASDIVFVEDEVKEFPHLIALSKRMMSTIKGNLAFAMILNFVAMGLSFSGVLNPVTGAFVHNAGSVLVIINSALLLKWRSH